MVRSVRALVLRADGTRIFYMEDDSARRFVAGDPTYRIASPGDDDWADPSDLRPGLNPSSTSDK